MRKKTKKEGFGRGLNKAAMQLENKGKMESKLLFGDRNDNPYSMPKEYEGAADEFFQLKKDKIKVKL